MEKFMFFVVFEYMFFQDVLFASQKDALDYAHRKGKEFSKKHGKTFGKWTVKAIPVLDNPLDNLKEFDKLLLWQRLKSKT